MMVVLILRMRAEGKRREMCAFVCVCVFGVLPLSSTKYDLFLYLTKGSARQSPGLGALWSEPIHLARQ